VLIVIYSLTPSKRRSASARQSNHTIEKEHRMDQVHRLGGGAKPGTVLSVVQSNDRLMTDRRAPDPHTFFGARMSCQQLMRFAGIAVDWMMAAEMASMPTHQSNVLRHSITGA
jgi:hypothetical protein